MIVGIVVFSVIVGAIGGAIVWNARAGLAVGGLATAALYFVAAAALGASNFRVLLMVGLPPLFLSFLTVSMAARALALHTRLGVVWVTLAALGSAFAAGATYLWLFRISLWATSVIALLADAVLIVLLMVFWTDARHDRAARSF